MSNKIGRNDPCPCGSGKKYKNCCMMTSQHSANQYDIMFPPFYVKAPKLKSYLEKHDVTPILDYLIALQLMPQNSGKNIRIEQILQLVVFYLGKGNNATNIKTFQAIIDEEFSFNVMEDLPINMFSEQVVFFGGNYQFFPGLSTHATELFRAMTEAIFHKEDLFPVAFCRDVYQGVLLMLKLGELLAIRANIRGLMRGCENPREKILSPLKDNSYAISEQVMIMILRENGLERLVLQPFLLDPNDPNLLTEIPEKNPILYKPIINYHGYYFLLGVSNQGCAINNFILKTAIKHKCLHELVHETHYGLWMRIGASCMEYMHWTLGQFSDLIVSDAKYNEELFRIDVNWLAYVCYAKDTDADVVVDGTERVARRNLDKYLKGKLATIRGDERTKGYHILTLVLYSSMGETFALSLGEQNDTDYQLEFSAFDFLQLVQTEKWDNMSLVRYARTKETKDYLKTPINQQIDIYSLYKHYGENFYFSDDKSPDWLNIEPNDGCHLIFESKEQLNYHGTPICINGKFAYIPVQRDMNYANIYEPINSSISAKSCESYTVPVWVKCSQTESNGLNPSSIIETVITAVAFWMETFCPSIDIKLNTKFKTPIEIDIRFSEEILFDMDISHDDLKKPLNGVLTTAKSDKGVTVFMDKDIFNSFMGSDNASERYMMLRIVMALLDINESESLDIIDKHMPLGHAKMILMMELSNNPMAYPMWLRPPIYIHEATHQLLLDNFPIWMKNKGHDIDGRLLSKKDKEAFLHSGVDVLLEVLEDHLKNFDTLWMLRVLINNHDTLIFQREHNRVIHPAQVICFGDTEAKRKDFFLIEKQITNAGLATRALIEYLSAIQCHTGGVQPGTDDVEWLLSIMNEIIDIGGICDAIHLEISDHIIEKLNSGRYGIFDVNFEDNLVDFASTRSAESINRDIEVFAEKMSLLAAHPNREAVEQDELYKKTDAAFVADWGISYSNILQFLYVCQLIALDKRKTVVEISDSDLIKEMNKYCSDLTGKIATMCLERLSLDKRDSYLTPPQGFDNKDIFPWSYNRELSYLRRPIIRYLQDDGTILCIFGFRSCLLAGLQLSELLYSGRLKKAGKQLSTLLGKYEAIKGKEFNETVRDFLKQFPELIVWKHDVSIKPHGNLISDRDYGDIDVLAFDTKRNILYSIECKNTNTAKNVREMKTEMDEYLGRGDHPEKDQRKALVLKHLLRHKWLLENMNQVTHFIGTVRKPILKSMMLTAAVIPTSYLKKEDTPLSILNYPALKRKGIPYLDSSKDPIINS